MESDERIFSVYRLRKIPFADFIVAVFITVKSHSDQYNVIEIGKSYLDNSNDEYRPEEGSCGIEQ